MMRVALRGLAGRKLRSLITAIAIVIGVAMVSGTYVLTDTIDRAFDTIFTESYAGTDAVVSAKSSDISFQGDTADTPPIRDSRPHVNRLERDIVARLDERQRGRRRRREPVRQQVEELQEVVAARGAEP